MSSRLLFYIGDLVVLSYIIPLVLFIPDLWFRDWIRLIAYSAVAITMWLDYVNLVRVRHTGQPIAFYDPMRKKMTPLKRKKKQ